MTRSSSRPRQSSPASIANLRWAKTTELVGLELELQPSQTQFLYPQYAVGLHAWFLNQVRQSNPELSAYLHDETSEKAFTLSRLEGEISTYGKSLRIEATQTYRWYITALSKEVVQWLATWLKSPPSTIELRNAPLKICKLSIAHVPSTYSGIWSIAERETLDNDDRITLPLSFISPTSFRRRGHHFPMPLPANVFQSYLRRWNDFSEIEFELEDFLEWVETVVLITRHHLRSLKVAAGKRGSVTGFVGAIEYGLDRSAYDEPEYVQLFHALGQLAPYCGTGHKTTFGLGQTRLGWTESGMIPTPPAAQDLLAQRIAELTELFKEQRKRTGGDRATKIAETWATIVARREMGESLLEIAEDLEMNYETVKSYSKLAKRSINDALLEE